MTQFEITLWPNPDAKDREENQVGLVFEVKLTNSYPDELPFMNLQPLKKVTSREAKALLQEVTAQGRDMLGVQMLYALTQFLKDWLDEKNSDNLSKQKEQSKLKAEFGRELEKQDYERRCRDGKFVTVENFKPWFDQYLKNHPEKIQFDESAVTNDDDTSSLISSQSLTGLLTGKQIFQRAALANLNLQNLEISVKDDKTSVDWSVFEAEEVNFDS